MRIGIRFEWQKKNEKKKCLISIILNVHFIRYLWYFYNISNDENMIYHYFIDFFFYFVQRVQTAWSLRGVTAAQFLLVTRCQIFFLLDRNSIYGFIKSDKCISRLCSRFHFTSSSNSNTANNIKLHLYLFCSLILLERSFMLDINSEYLPYIFILGFIFV